MLAETNMPLYTASFTLKSINNIKCPKKKEKIKAVLENKKGNGVYRSFVVTGVLITSVTELLFG